MNLTDLYNESIQDTLQRSSNTLLKKREEYAPEADPLSNFKEGAEMSGQTPEQVLFMYCLKHLVSVRDIIFGKVPSTTELIREKTGDIINYMVLLNAIQDEKDALEKLATSFPFPGQDIYTTSDIQTQGEIAEEE